MNFISTAPLAGYNIGYSPFHRSRLAVACAANYGVEIYIAFIVSKFHRLGR